VKAFKYWCCMCPIMCSCNDSDIFCFALWSILINEHDMLLPIIWWVWIYERVIKCFKCLFGMICLTLLIAKNYVDIFFSIILICSSHFNLSSIYNAKNLAHLVLWVLLLDSWRSMLVSCCLLYVNNMLFVSFSLINF